MNTAITPQIWFWIWTALALILSRLPYIGVFFRNFNTLVHEFGHAATTLLLSGRVRKIELFQDSSGQTLSESSNAWSTVLIALAGYPCSLLSAWGMYALIQHGRHEILLFSMLCLMIFNLVFFVRNAYGILWLLLCGGLLLGIIWLDRPMLSQAAAIFLAFIVLSDALISTLQLWMASLRDSKKAGDASLLQKTTHIPAIVWASVFVVMGGGLIYMIIHL